MPGIASQIQAFNQSVSQSLSPPIPFTAEARVSFNQIAPHHPRFQYTELSAPRPHNFPPIPKGPKKQARILRREARQEAQIDRIFSDWQASRQWLSYQAPPSPLPSIQPLRQTMIEAGMHILGMTGIQERIYAGIAPAAETTAMTQYATPVETSLLIREKRGDIPAYIQSVHPYLAIKCPPLSTFGQLPNIEETPRNKIPYYPQPAQSVSVFILGLREFFHEYKIDINVKTQAGLAIKNLFHLIHDDAKTFTSSFKAPVLPHSKALDSLTQHLMTASGLSIPLATMPADKKEVFQRQIIGKMLFVLIKPGRRANEVGINVFDFLQFIRANKKIEEIKKGFECWLSLHAKQKNNVAIRWAASMILPLLHPEFSRTDTPAHLLYGSLEWADFTSAIALLTATGIDHGDFSYEELIDFSRHTQAGARLNETAGREIWRIQVPVALWYAHANKKIDLETDEINTSATIETAIDYLDNQRVTVLKKTLNDLTFAISELRRKKETDETQTDYDGAHETAVSQFLGIVLQMGELGVIKNIARESLISSTDNPALLPDIAEKFKRALTPFYECSFSSPGELPEMRLETCGIELNQNDADFMRRQHSETDRAKYIETMICREVRRDVIIDVSHHFRTQLPDYAPTLIPHTLSAILQKIQIAAAIKSASTHSEDLLSSNNERLIATPSVSDNFSSTLAKMLARNPSIELIQERFEMAGVHRSPQMLSSFFLPTIIADNEERILQHFQIPLSIDVRQIPHTEREAQGIVTFALNGRYYQIDLYSFEPSLQLHEDIQRRAQNLPLCREERALKKNAKGSDACEETTQFTDENDRQGRMIEHRNRYIQMSLTEAMPQRPRREATIFFPENQGTMHDDSVAIIDQILFRRRTASLALEDIQYRRISQGEHSRHFSEINSLPEMIEGRLVDLGQAERPMVEYTLDSAPLHASPLSNETTQIRTRIRRDFFSRITPSASREGMLQVAEGWFYIFRIPDRLPGASVDINLYHTTNAGDINDFTQQPTVEHTLRSEQFSVNISQAHASTLIDIIWRCDAARNLAKALETRSPYYPSANNPIISNALIAYIEDYTGESIDSARPIPDPVMTQLNLSLSDILKSVSATRDLRVLLRDNYQRQRPNVVFDEIIVPPIFLQHSDTHPVSPERNAIETSLRERTGLFSDIFPELNFDGVWAIASPPNAELMPSAHSRVQIITEEFIRVFQRRNVAVASIKLRNGRLIHYFSISGTKPIPHHKTDNPNYILVRDIPAVNALLPLPHLPNMAQENFGAQSREGDTERALLSRLQVDFPERNAIESVRIISLLEICHSCTICCIAYAERHRNATMEFLSFPKAAILQTSVSGSHHALGDL